MQEKTTEDQYLINDKKKNENGNKICRQVKFIKKGKHSSQTKCLFNIEFSFESTEYLTKTK